MILYENDENNKGKNKKLGLTTTILLAIVICVVFIIVIIFALLKTTENKEYCSIYVDGKGQKLDKNNIITKIDNIDYINIEKFAQLVGYEYHKGKYKSFTIEEDSCYVECDNETATFLKDQNKVYKSLPNDLTSDYLEHSTEYAVKDENGNLFATKDAVEIAFNVIISEEEKAYNIYTLNYLVTSISNNIKQWNYTNISELNFENKKAIKYGYLIVNKENGLYKIINNKNEEITTAKYKSIQFNELTQEFFVTNSSGQVGIIKSDGSIKIEPIYDSIEVLDNQNGLYVVTKSKKYGVVKDGKKVVLDTEYDAIGVNGKMILLSELIPVCKDKKWGAYNLSGNLILDIKYDSFGCNETTVSVNEETKKVDPVITIEKCNGVVVKLNKNYGIVDKNGKELVPTEVSAIYSVTENDKTDYYMIYKEKELNIIERLIAAGVIEDKTNIIVKEKSNNNKISNESEEIVVNLDDNTVED